MSLAWGAFAGLAVLGLSLSVRAQQPAIPPAPATLPTGQVDFVRDIQPIFQKSCLGCHGAKAQMGGLRLDAKAGAFAGGTSGAGIKPGHGDDSNLYHRVAGIGDQARMPMGGKPLPPEQIALIKAWIDQGAVWPDGVGAAVVEKKKHWAFLPPQRPALPEVSDAIWARNPIDRFILAKLDKEGLKPSPEAAKATLLRRLALDLTGLPPTPAEVDAFLQDTSPNAYEKQVDRLLASPHYGERWARHWLDAARYADSDGFEKDKQRQVWFFRDWVINAFNKDLPYNRFLTEQLAGDLLPNATQDQIVATGFLRNSMINEEGGVDPEQFRMEAMFDRMDAIGKGMLGVTVQCTQCHNHKYDPITQEEYYKLFAFFNNSHEGSVAVYTPDEQRQRADLFAKVRMLETDLQHRTPDWQQRMAQWEEQVKKGQPTWQVVKPEVDDISTGGQKYVPLPDGSMLASGYAPTKHRAKMTFKTDLPKVTGVRLELLTDPNLPRGGPGRAPDGSAALTEFDVEAAPADQPYETEKVKIASATADVNPPETPLKKIFDDKTNRRRVTGPVAFAIDGKEETAWGTDVGPGQRNQPRKAVFTFDLPVGYAKGTILTVYLRQSHGGWNSDDNQSINLGRVRLSITGDEAPKVDPVPANVREILNTPRDQRTPAQTATVFRYWRTTVPEWKEANAQIDKLWQQHPEGTTQLVLAERDDRRMTSVLQRGDFLKPTKAVEPGTPAFLNPWPEGAPRNRLGLAQWLTDRNAPTTARSLVNRVWQNYFGTGIVATSEDFGTQSEAPSHPELLDWLAVEFMDQGWSLKKLHKAIVTSNTYRQSSKVSSDLLQKDPYNRLLARGPRFRVEAEVIRDIALAASGLLNDQVGGASVYPPAPDFLFQPPVSYGPKIWDETKSADRYRRGLYTFRYRSVPYPMLQVYDAPNGDAACVRRTRSNTPLQALTSLNEPLFMEAAQALALKTLREGGATDRERLNYAFRRTLARPATDFEARTLLALLEKQNGRLQQGWLNAWDLANFDPQKAKLPPGLTPNHLAAWTAVSRVVLNLDEAITKE